MWPGQATQLPIAQVCKLQKIYSIPLPFKCIILHHTLLHLLPDRNIYIHFSLACSGQSPIQHKIPGIENH